MKTSVKFACTVFLMVVFVIAAFATGVDNNHEQCMPPNTDTPIVLL